MSLLIHPMLRDCRRLFLRDFVIEVRIGVYERELAAPQRLRFNVELYVPLGESTPSRDRLEEVVDYDFILDAIRERVARGHVQLQETLVDELLKTMLSHPKVRAARIWTEKPDIYADCEAVGVEVFGMKEASP